MTVKFNPNLGNVVVVSDGCAFIAEVIKKYSNFVGVPIYLNGKKVNVIQVSGLVLCRYHCCIEVYIYEYLCGYS